MLHVHSSLCHSVCHFTCLKLKPTPKWLTFLRSYLWICFYCCSLSSLINNNYITDNCLYSWFYPSKAKIPLVCNMNGNDKCEWWMALGDRCSFCPAQCVQLCLGPVYEGDFQSDKSFVFALISTCSDSFCRICSSHSHLDEWNHCTNSMR